MAINSNDNIKAYLVGGGIASLSAAFYLIKYGHLLGCNIHILSEEPPGGSLDAGGTAAKGYSMRGSRMYGAAYVLTYDLLSHIPSLNDPKKSVIEDTLEFWQSTPWYDNARLVEDGKIVSLSSWDFDDEDRVDIIRLMLFAEDSLGAKRIDECFGQHFFKSKFWIMWSSMFGFETWHSAIEMRRYLLRFLRLFPDLETLQPIQSTRFNSYDSIIRPLVSWLEGHGVQIETGVMVTDLDFSPGYDARAVSRISCRHEGGHTSIDVGEDDLVIVTLGSMTAGSDFGSMTSAPRFNKPNTDGAWELWKRLAQKSADFGCPSTFCDHISQTKWITFSVTDFDDLFARRMQQLSSSSPGCGGLVTLSGSSWLLTFHLFHPPAYFDQPEGVLVWWGYGLLPDSIGDYVKKKMSDCNGREILIELFSHLGFQDDIPTLLKSSNCIPCMLPYTTSQFMPRQQGDRPEVIPAGTVNLAFVGQYCEIPDNVVYTIEYSIHSALLAVTSLLGLPNVIAPTYKGLEHPYALVSALQRILR